MKHTVPEGKAQGELHLLLVDDDPIIQLLHKKIVKDIVPDLPLVTFKHGAEALDHILSGSHRNTRFLVLLDINMPVMNGWEFLDQCEKRRLTNVKVVMVSSSINHSDRAAAAAYPQVFRYCEKPLNKMTFTQITMQKEVEHLFRPPLNRR